MSTVESPLRLFLLRWAKLLQGKPTEVKQVSETTQEIRYQQREVTQNESDK